MIADNEAVSINKYLKEKKIVTIQSKRLWIFVAPAYFWRMSKVVEQ